MNSNEMKVQKHSKKRKKRDDSRVQGLGRHLVATDYPIVE